MLRNYLLYNNYFTTQISTKFGNKCCKYGLNGIPFTKEQCDNMFSTLSQYLKGWNLNEDRTRLNKYIYVEDYYNSHAIIKRIIDTDNYTHKNKPSIRLYNGDLIDIELYSIPLKGLSQVDFELAIKINSIEFKKYGCYELDNNKNYRAKVRVLKNEYENNKINEVLKDTENLNNKN